MANNGYAKGAKREHRSMEVLESAGFRCFRTAGSHGAFDVIGISATSLLLVQVKSRDWPGVLETETLREFPVPTNAKKLIHRWRDRQRLPDVKEVV